MESEPQITQEGVVDNINEEESPTKIWADGCYDVLHFGHANNFRQAKNLGKTLVVGVHSDEDIKQHKGIAPVFNEKERAELAQAIKWVDKVVEQAPFVTTLETLVEHGCDYSAHGDDVSTTEDGTDTYHKVRDAKRYKEVDRTPGISTTDLINRMIKTSELSSDRDNNNNEVVESSNEAEAPNPEKPKSAYTGNSKLLLTTQKLLQFNPTPTPPISGSPVVYVAGSFDVFNVGHLRFLQKAKELGSYLIVGVFDDTTANLVHGPGYPIMTLNERIFTLQGYECVSDVIFGAPLELTKDLLKEFNVTVVAIGKEGARFHPVTKVDLYKEAESILKILDSGSGITTKSIVARVGQDREAYKERNRKKEEKEAALEKKRQHQAANCSLSN